MQVKCVYLELVDLVHSNEFSVTRPQRNDTHLALKNMGLGTNTANDTNTCDVIEVSSCNGWPVFRAPPALVTAAARRGPAATFMPASMTGCWILNSLVKGVSNTLGEDGMVLGGKSELSPAAPRAG